MKIENGGRVTPIGAPRRAGSSGGAGFTPEADAPGRTAAMGSVSGVTALDAILALQSDEPPAKRRARQARRGREALDALERLEHGLVLGRAPATLRGEMDALRRSGETTGEAGLDEVLREIDTRLAVEVAKLDRIRLGA